MVATRKIRQPSDLLTVGQVAQRLNVHPNTVRRWATLGLLRAYRIGSQGDRRFQTSDVDRVLQFAVE